MTGAGALRRAGARRLAAAYALGELSDSLAAVGIALFVLDATGSVAWTTAYFIVAKGLPALIAPAITAALDRRAAARLGWLYGTQALLTGAICLLTSPAAVLPFAALAASAAIPARSLTRAQIARRLVHVGELREGNALVNVAFAAAATVGAAAGGGLVALAGSPAALAAGAVAALVALPLVRGTSGRGAVTPANWWSELNEGLRFARTTRGVGSLLWLQAFALLAFTLVIPVEVVYAKRSLDAGAVGYGALIAAWGAGILVGGFGFALLRRHSLLMLAFASTGLIGLSYLGLAVATTLPIACLIAFAGGVGNGTQWVAVVTALQEAVPDALQARVVGLLDSAATLAPVLAYTLGGFLAQTLSPRAAYAVAGTVALVCAAAFARQALGERVRGAPAFVAASLER